MTPNHDQAELDKFAPLAAHWWDENGPLKTLHQINPIRLKYIDDKVLLKDKSVLDIGCGGGILTESLAQKGALVTGIDLNKSLIDIAKLHQRESHLQIEYLHTDAETLAKERPAQYDVVTCLELLEHVPDPLSVIKACQQLVKPQGLVFFSTINRNLKAYLFAIIGAEYLLKLLPKNTHDYAKFIKPSELSTWTRQAKLTPQGIQGLTYHPYTQQVKLSRDVSVNYLFYAKKEA